MKRISLVQYQQMSLTPDTVGAMNHLNTRAVEHGNLSLTLEGFSRDKHSWEHSEYWSRPTGGQAWLSLVPAGRQIWIRATFKDSDQEGSAKAARELAALWGMAVPVGFTPWVRYPVLDENDQHLLFTFLGPWQTLYDHLVGEGRGEAAWPSVCCAAQVDVGAWEGTHKTERFVQAQLHRVGVSVGVLDGVVGERTLGGLKRLGLDRKPLTEAAKVLAATEPSPQTASERRIGHIVLPGQNSSIVTTGKVYSTKTAQGAALTLDGPGRVFIDITPKEPKK